MAGGFSGVLSEVHTESVVDLFETEAGTSSYVASDVAFGFLLAELTLRFVSLSFCYTFGLPVEWTLTHCHAGIAKFRPLYRDMTACH